MVIFQYVYYKILGFWNKLSFGISRMQYRAATFFAMLISLNFVSVLDYLEIKLWESYLITISIMVAWIAVNYCYFVNPKNHRRIIKKFRNESTNQKVIGSLSVIVYIALSVGFFFSSMKK